MKNVEERIRELIEVGERKYMLVENKQERQETGLNDSNWLIYEADENGDYNGL